ncbi:MAG TPA: cobalamin-binding protein [Micropepsaceae bacterium]|nr:cobalamin-binding protein [Micropepsaceae bacterium]
MPGFLLVLRSHPGMSGDSAQRIVSFLPAATEMVYALGLGDRLFGVTHECDHPPEARHKQVVVRSVLAEGLRQREIDEEVKARLQQGQSLYEADTEALTRIAPDLIITQELCSVCAPSGNEISEVLKVLPKKPQILWLTPKTLDGIFDNLREIGSATGRAAKAESLIARYRHELELIGGAAAADGERPRLFFMEWLDPVYCSGHWVPEMVHWAGGIDALGRAGQDSARIAWRDVLEYGPEIIVVAPCGFDLERSAGAAQELLPAYPGWRDLPAVRSSRVFAVDANSYFARPGPRVIAGTQLLAHLIHPEAVPWNGPSAFRQVAR